jgi:hypothetical protein
MANEDTNAFTPVVTRALLDLVRSVTYPRHPSGTLLTNQPYFYRPTQTTHALNAQNRNPNPNPPARVSNRWPTRISNSVSGSFQHGVTNWYQAIVAKALSNGYCGVGNGWLNGFMSISLSLYMLYWRREGEVRVKYLDEMKWGKARWDEMRWLMIGYHYHSHNEYGYYFHA